jgi:hypothetical protein
MTFAREGAKARRFFARRGAERRAGALARFSPLSEIERLLAQPSEAPPPALRLCANQFLSTLASTRPHANKIEATR